MYFGSFSCRCIHNGTNRIISPFQVCINILVGGFNPSEKYQSVGMNHQPALHFNHNYDHYSTPNLPYMIYTSGSEHTDSLLIIVGCGQPDLPELSALRLGLFTSVKFDATRGDNSRCWRLGDWSKKFLVSLRPFFLHLWITSILH